MIGIEHIHNSYYVSAFCKGKACFAILVDVVIQCTKKKRQKKDTLQAFCCQNRGQLHHIYKLKTKFKHENYGLFFQ